MSVDGHENVTRETGAERMTHAGESYTCDTPQARRAIARQERDRTVLAAQRLR